MDRPAVVPLDGADWSCKGYLGEEWRLRRAVARDTRDLHGWLPARVPGSVLDDVVRAGVAPDPRNGLDSLACEWVPDRTWVYRREVEVERADGRSVLEFDGIDHAAEVFVNGQHVGAHLGSFTPARFDVTAALEPGRNLIAVAIAPAPDDQPHVGRTEHVKVLRSRMTNGWDFCPRIVHLGIWDRARLLFPGPAEIADVVARPRLASGSREASLWWQVTVDAEQAAAGQLAMELVRDEVVVASSTADVWLGGTHDVIEGSLAVEHPELWWPNGSGAQPLYDLRVRLTTDKTVSTATVTTAFRSVELARNEGAPDDARPYTFVVNGEPTWIHGWNWVPMHVHHGVEDDDRLDHLLGLAARAGVNLLRVWGGGLIEKRAFYERCDRLGIMVWQEFPLSSSLLGSVPSDDPDYVHHVLEQARGIVPRRRNHPSLVVWCGGNELDDDRGAPACGDEPVLAGLAKVVTELDPDRVWLPTSPTGPVATFTHDAVDADPDGLHDVHGPWEHQGLRGHHELYARASSLFHSEFGVEGMADVATIEHHLRPEHRMPADRSNPYTVHRGDFWINTPLIEEVFGPIDDLATLVRASQLLQADGLRAAIDANRRRMWLSSGSIPWQLNEPFPNVFCTSAVDHAGRPKAAYHAVADAYAPVSLGVELPTQAWAGRDRFEASVWVTTRTRASLAGQVELRVLDLAGVERQRQAAQVTVPAAGSTRLLEVSWPIVDDVALFVVDAALRDDDGAVRARSRWLCSTGTDLRELRSLTPAQLELGRPEQGRIEIRHLGDQVAIGVTARDARPVDAPGYAWFDRGNLTLLPGEVTRIRAGWIGAPEQPRPVVVDAWNTEAVTLG